MSSAAKIYETFEDYDFDDLCTYAGVDAIVTLELASKISSKMSSKPEYTVHDGTIITKKVLPSLMEVNNSVVLKAMDFMVDLELNGIKYDVDLNKVVRVRLDNEISLLDEVILPHMPVGINLDSGTELARFLYGNLGLTPPHYTKSGQPSTDGDAISALAESYGLTWMKTLAKRGDLQSLNNTFVKNYVKDFVRADGRIHPSYNLHGTSGFRITASGPNLTQLPREKHGYNLRELYKVEEGSCMILLDFSSAEVKILGAMSRDPGLLKAIVEGLDFHSFSACEMFGYEYKHFVEVLKDEHHPDYKKYKGIRQAAKAITFGLLYGSSAAGIARNSGKSVAEAEALIELYFSKFPLIRKYIEDTHNMAISNKFVTTPFGRRKMKYGLSEVFKNTVVYNAELRNSQNMRIQSATSDIGLMAFSEVNERIKKYNAKSICTVYDSIEIECPVEHAEKVLEIAFYCMDDWPQKEFDWIDFSIGVEAEIGTTWGNARVVKRGSTQLELESVLNNIRGEK